jgi:hypothetical protein
MAHNAFLGYLDLIFIRVPQRIPEALQVLQGHLVIEIWNVFHVALLQVSHRLFPPVVLPIAGVKNDLRIEALLQFLRVPLIKSEQWCIADSMCSYSVCTSCRSERRDLPL